MVGTRMPLSRDPVMHGINENGHNLVPWRGSTGAAGGATGADSSSGEEIRIDRFDGRSMLDLIIEYRPPVVGSGGGSSDGSTAEEQELEVCLNHERYRSIIEAVRVGMNEEQHLRVVESEIAAKIAAYQSAMNDFAYKKTGSDKTEPDGKSDGARIGFQYDNANNSDGSDAEEDGEGEDEEEDADAREDQPTTSTEAEVEAVANCKLFGFD